MEQGSKRYAARSCFSFRGQKSSFKFRVSGFIFLLLAFYIPLCFFFREPILLTEEGGPGAKEVCAGDAGIIGNGGLPREGIGGVR